MTEPTDDLEVLWSHESEVHPQIHEEVIAQSRRWWLTSVFECLGLLVGVFAPLFVVLRSPEVFWVFWAVDIWIVVVISGWFVYLRIKDLLVDVEQTTKSYLAVLSARHRLQVRVANIGMLLASLQFITLPILAWWQMETEGVLLSEIAEVYGSVLIVMAAYIFMMARVSRVSKKKLSDLNVLE